MVERSPLGELLQSLRTASGLTQQGWAYLLGASRTTLYRWEQDGSMPISVEDALIEACVKRGVPARLNVTTDRLRELIAAARRETGLSLERPPEGRAVNVLSPQLSKLKPHPPEGLTVITAKPAHKVIRGKPRSEPYPSLLQLIGDRGEKGQYSRTAFGMKCGRRLRDSCRRASGCFRITRRTWSNIWIRLWTISVGCFPTNYWRRWTPTSFTFWSRQHTSMTWAWSEHVQGRLRGLPLSNTKPRTSRPM